MNAQGNARYPVGFMNAQENETIRTGKYTLPCRFTRTHKKMAKYAQENVRYSVGLVFTHRKSLPHTEKLNLPARAKYSSNPNFPPLPAIHCFLIHSVSILRRRPFHPPSQQSPSIGRHRRRTLHPPPQPPHPSQATTAAPSFPSPHR